MQQQVWRGLFAAFSQTVRDPRYRLSTDGRPL